MITYIKIVESIGITIFTYLAGYIRQKTGGFNGVTLCLIGCAFVSLLGSYGLLVENRSIGYDISLLELPKNLLTQILKLKD